MELFDSMITVDTRLRRMEREYKLLKSTANAIRRVERNMAKVMELENGGRFCRDDYCDGIVSFGASYCDGRQEHRQ